MRWILGGLRLYIGDGSDDVENREAPDEGVQLFRQACGRNHCRRWHIWHPLSVPLAIHIIAAEVTISLLFIAGILPSIVLVTLFLLTVSE